VLEYLGSHLLIIFDEIHIIGLIYKSRISTEYSLLVGRVAIMVPAPKRHTGAAIYDRMACIPAMPVVTIIELVVARELKVSMQAWRKASRCSVPYRHLSLAPAQTINLGRWRDGEAGLR